MHHSLPPTTFELLAVGAKILNVDPVVTTSAHAEYEGLLLGLEWLCQNQQEWLLQSVDDGSFTLVVRGDCKSVLDQLHHPMLLGSTKNVPRSHPRVMQMHYQRAMAYLQQLLVSSESPPATWSNPRTNDVMQMSLSSSSAPAGAPKLIVEHVPRLANNLCDQLCAQVMEYVEEEAYNDLVNDVVTLKSLHQNHYLSTITSSTPSSTTVNSSCAALLQTLHKYHLVGPTGEYCLIRYSLRPPLYRYLAQVADDVGDDEVLQLLGQSLEKEARTVWSSSKPMSMPKSNSAQESGIHLSLLQEAYQYQMDAIILPRSSNRLSKNHKQQERRLRELKRKQGHLLAQQLRARRMNQSEFIGTDESTPSGYEYSFPRNKREHLVESLPKWFPSTRPTVHGIAEKSTTLFDEETVLAGWRTFLQTELGNKHESESKPQRQKLGSKGLWLLL